MQFKIVQCYPLILSWYIVYYIVASHSLENEALTKANKMTAADRKEFTWTTLPAPCY